MQCKICNSTNTKCFLNDPQIIECEDCKNSFRLEPPIKISEVYTKGIPMPNFFETKIRNRHHYNFIDSNIGFDNIQSILEIGPGNGSFINFIRKKNKSIKITVIEPGDIFYKKLLKIKNITVINDFIENVKIENTTFDLVIMSHVLEHLKDPQVSLCHVYKNFLQKDSYLYIDIPNKDYELRSINSSKVAPLIHLFFFDGIGIKNLLKSIGFNEDLIIGKKYSSLPIDFIHGMEKLGGVKHNQRLLAVKLKIANRISLCFSNFFKFLFAKNLKENKLNINNFSFNNIAVIAKKS